MERPTFLVLAEAIPVSELPELLGRFVVDYSSPLDISAPKSVKDIAQAHGLEPVESQDLSVLLKSSKNSSGLAKLQATLEVMANKSWSQDLHIQSSKVKTHRLKDHDKVFKAVLDNAERLKEVTNLFAYAKRGLVFQRNNIYMIVGVKTITNSSQSLEHSDHQSKGASVDLPVSQAVNAAAPGAGLGVPNPRVEGASEQKQEQKQLSKTLQELVFSVEYRIINQSRFRKTRLQFGAKKRFNWGNAVMGEDDEDEEGDGDHALRKEDLTHPASVAVIDQGDFDFLLPTNEEFVRKNGIL